jgi:hypothetical protein
VSAVLSGNLCIGDLLKVERRYSPGNWRCSRRAVEQQTPPSSTTLRLLLAMSTVICKHYRCRRVSVVYPAGGREFRVSVGQARDRDRTLLCGAGLQQLEPLVQRCLPRQPCGRLPSPGQHCRGDCRLQQGHCARPGVCQGERFAGFAIRGRAGWFGNVAVERVGDNLMLDGCDLCGLS